MSYLEELLPEFRKGAKIRCSDWDKDLYIYMKNNCVYSSDMSKHLDYDILSNEWEFYQEPEPIGWDYIIKNKCLCWFWDDDESEKIVGILINVEKDEYTPFLLYGEYYFEHCHPVRRDEVTFYEDKE